MRTLSTLLLAVPTLLGAQLAAPTQRVEIRTSASAVTELPASGAVLSVNFSVSRKTPGDAGRANAERATAIRNAVLALGIPADSITTRGYASNMTVARERRDTTFVASNTLLVRLSQLHLVSQVIDTVLAEGATNISGLRFWASGTEEAQLHAIGNATRRARRQAEALAAAAGGRVGRLLELSTDSPSSGVTFERVLDSPSSISLISSERHTPVQAPAVSVSVTAYTRWEFLPDGP